MSSSYPKALSYYISRMNNFSRNKVRLATIANTSFTANDQIVIQLPEGLIDLSTFTLTGRLSTADGAAHGVYAPFIEGCIDSIMIEIGGVAVQSGFTNYNDLFNIYRQYQMEDRKSFRRVLQNEATQPVGGTASNYTCSNVPFAIYNWLGFLSSVKVLDTTILPPVKLYIRLAPNSILTVHAGNTATRTYRWNDVKASVDILDISDGVYYTMIAQRLAQSPLELPFDNYQTVTGSLGAVTQTTRWSTSTDCLTDVIATVKPSYFEQAGANSNTCLSHFFTRGGGTQWDTAIATSQFSVNGIRYPTIPCQNADGEVFTQTAHTLGVSQDVLGQTDPSMSTLPLWSSNFFVHANSFTYPDAEDAHRLVGLSGRGNQILGTFETTGTGSNVLPVVFLKSKSVLRVGAGKMVEAVL
jgi:hypothetical protein